MSHRHLVDVTQTPSRCHTDTLTILIEEYPINNTHKQERAREGAASVVVENGFERFWDAYPKRVEEQAARVEWNRLNPDPELRHRIMRSLAKEKDSRQWRDEGGRYIPKPESWLCQRRWNELMPTQAMIDAKYLTEPDFIALYGKGGVGRGKDSLHPRDAPLS
ncbi:MAG: hypothetical protein DDT39_01610 [Firmicutes bacterium]|nr:hypothetical protein [candidate division NPL-UPA2 bacterium]